MNSQNQLSTHQIDVVASHRSNFPQPGFTYAGTKASDEALLVLERSKPQAPWGMIFNVDPIDQPGSHWLALYQHQESEGIDIFDSYGNEGQEGYQGHAFLGPILKKTNPLPNQRLQGNKTYVCGHYCLAYLYNRTREIKSKDFYQSFPGPYLTNDKTVCRFVCQVMIPPKIFKKFKKAYIGPLGHPCQGCCCYKDQDEYK